MYDKHYIGLDVTAFERNGTHRPVSKVTLNVDSNKSYSAGDDSGFEISADCPYATQAMADRILASVRGIEYKMYNASDANLDPAAELGDGVTVCGLYSVIGTISDDGYGYPDISAPGEEELEYEYPYESYTKRRLDNLESEIDEISSDFEDIKTEFGELSELIDGLVAGIAGVITFNGRDGNVLPEREDYLEFIVEEIQEAIYESWEAKY